MNRKPRGSQAQRDRERAGAAAFLELCDPMRRQRVAEALLAVAMARDRGVETGRCELLRDGLLPSIECAMEWLNLRAPSCAEVTSLAALAELASEAADLIDGGLDLGADSCARSTRRALDAWTQWAADAQFAATLAAANLSATNSKAAKRKRGRAKALTARDLADRMTRAGVVELGQELAAEIAAEFKMGQRTVYARLNEARLKGLLP